MKIRCFNLANQRVWYELPADGILTPEMRWVFANGHCHSFALALHRLTGWTMAGHMNPDGLSHVMCVQPNGMAVDAEGSRPTPPGWIDDYHGYIRSCLRNHTWPRLVMIPPDYEYKYRHGWLHCAPDKVMSFAESRLRELEAETEPTKVYPTQYPSLPILPW